MSTKTILIVGNPEINHIGHYFHNAANELGILAGFADVRDALSGNDVINKVYWHCFGHRPARLDQFGRKVLELCESLKPGCLLCTGLAPLGRDVLKRIGELSIVRINYLTDDPWNPSQRSSWFMKALPLYDHVFSVRQANIPDLKKLNGPRIHYLPFAYAPEVHFPELPATEDEKQRYSCDVVFIGGADKDRLPYIRALIEAGIHLHLYGGYWDRFTDTKKYWKGHANPEQMRKAVSGAKVNLCLVRRANRDGNSMRSFEVPAMAGCLLLEDTNEHRLIFGDDNIYFKTILEMHEKLTWLLSQEKDRKRFAQLAHDLVVHGRHTYKDRIASMLKALMD